MPSPTAPTVADTMTLDTSKESATQSLYRAAIGPLNNDYYLPIFSGFESTGKISLRWNTAASLYTLNWMVFRRLWGAALVYTATVLGGALLVIGLGRLVLQLSTEVELALAILMLMLSFVVPGLLGNAWLHTDSRRRMALALNQSNTLQQACGRLQAQSSSRNRFLGVVAVNLALISAGLGLYLQTEDVVQVKEPAPLPVVDTTSPPRVTLLIEAKTPESVDEVPATPTEPTPAPDPLKVSELPTAPPLAVAIAPTPTPTQTPVPVPVPTTVPVSILDKKATPAKKVGVFVNVGLFANTDNAERAHQRLKEAGLAVTTETLNTSKGKRSRVSVGPFPSRAEADAAARSIRALELDAVVRSP